MIVPWRSRARGRCALAGQQLDARQRRRLRESGNGEQPEQQQDQSAHRQLSFCLDARYHHSSFRRKRGWPDRGVVGVRLTWRRLADLPDLAEEPYRGFLGRIADCGMHVELLAAGASLPVLLPHFAAARVPLVVDHFGVPSRDPAERRAGTDALLHAIDGGRTWVKLSAGFRLPDEIVAECTTQLLAAGPERLLWGSDAPFVNHEDSVDYAAALALYRRLVPDAATRRAIDATAIKLFFD
ncbi:MAG: amidohydrolase family protein [Sphingomonas sp.]